MADTTSSTTPEILTKPTLAVTGMSGLVGSTLAKVIGHEFNLVSLDLSDPVNPVDITKLDSVKKALTKAQPTAVLHLAAFTNVTAAFEQNGDKNGSAYLVNVLGTQNVVQVCQELNIRLIHMSTAYIFDGQKTEAYLEEDQPNPIEWYGQTKLEAEKIVQATHQNSVILRIDQPFRQEPFAKQDIAHRIVAGLQANSLYPQFTDHFFSPTVIEDLAKVIGFFVTSNHTGVWHATSGEMWNDFDLANLIKTNLQLPGEVKPGKLADYLKTINRPYQQNTTLDISKLLKVLPFKLTSISEAVSKLVI